ncbi:cytidine/deoxycytidylate deaminase family protein [Rickettsiella massiliensis]|uniref:deoxycytidylate deaminase n=1 Tax=Rickettsiella massiliensis TaxID=676517 RepID=UPI00029A0A04|nr:deoxycytidylate deaminase [Rickettsiella massiliensis]
MALSSEKDCFGKHHVNEEGLILCKAADCTHISPLFHAEALAIHALIMKKDKPQLGKLNLYSTAEPDVLSQSAIHWAKVAHDLEIKRVCFGSLF